MPPPALNDEERAESRRSASSRYNARNREARNEKTKVRMARGRLTKDRLRASEGNLPAQAQASRREARLASARRYRERNRARLAQEAAWHREHKAREKRLAELKAARRAYLAAKEQETISTVCDLGDTVTLLSATTMPLFTEDWRLVPLTSNAIPEDFIPCVIPDHLGPNFTNHIDFTRKSTKRYWVLFVPKETAGLYSLKETCFKAAGNYNCTEDAFVWFQGWRDAWGIWARHCYERHDKCPSHPNACADGICPTHPEPQNPEVVVLPDIKKEPVPQIIKREEMTGDRSQRGEGTSRVTTSRSRRHTKARKLVWESGSDSDDGRVRVPLYDPDTPPEKRRRGLQDTDLNDGEESAPPASEKFTLSAGPPLSPTVTSASSLSASTITSQAPVSGSALPRPFGATLTAGASTSRTASSASRAGGGTPSAGQGIVHRDDTFYVSASGGIHHSREGAFEEIGQGMVQVALGWDEATEMASEFRRKRAARRARPMEVDE
ncbi:hypothetical protein C8F04DRAFT_1175223 [Mycena alexandri]|uniref:Uncharacterized protein n=1 Tax=Mycena alexandri TaxID=1745969 RepID=A0AAD6XBV2_9AGAR|nr:hypothetical protein C8F04DRAFT_1175223 [Mycena alexandri]